MAYYGNARIRSGSHLVCIYVCLSFPSYIFQPTNLQQNMERNDPYFSSLAHDAGELNWELSFYQNQRTHFFHPRSPHLGVEVDLCQEYLREVNTNGLSLNLNLDSTYCVDTPPDYIINVFINY